MYFNPYLILVWSTIPNALALTYKKRTEILLNVLKYHYHQLIS